MLKVGKTATEMAFGSRATYLFQDLTLMVEIRFILRLNVTLPAGKQLGRRISMQTNTGAIEFGKERVWLGSHDQTAQLLARGNGNHQLIPLFQPYGPQNTDAADGYVAHYHIGYRIEQLQKCSPPPKMKKSYGENEKLQAQ